MQRCVQSIQSELRVQLEWTSPQAPAYCLGASSKAKDENFFILRRQLPTFAPLSRQHFVSFIAIGESLRLRIPL